LPPSRLDACRRGGDRGAGTGAAEPGYGGPRDGEKPMRAVGARAEAAGLAGRSDPWGGDETLWLGEADSRAEKRKRRGTERSHRRRRERTERAVLCAAGAEASKGTT